MALVILALSALTAGCVPEDEVDQDEDSPGVSLGVAAIGRLEATGAIPSLDRSPSVPGPDTDSNGIRDDIDAYIDQRVEPGPLQKAARQSARVLQRQLLVDPNDPVAVKAVAAELMRAVNCVGDVYDSMDDGTRQQVLLPDLEAMTVNTRPRAKALQQFSRALNGKVLSLPNGDTCD